uniref:Uncharacterized protein n=1 Tax=Buteo japonicus TaxID=224669 RepID=A0A8C0B950_9AVES
MRVVGAGCCPDRQTRARQGPRQDRGEATRCHSQHSSGFSSELSPQSSSPSHFQARGLHSVLLHWNSSRGHVRTFSSSVPSMQSASASQRQRMGMQCPFLHWNWSNSHSLLPVSADPLAAAGRRKGSSALARSARAGAPVPALQGTGTDSPSQINAPAGPAPAPLVPSLSAGGRNAAQPPAQDGSSSPFPPPLPWGGPRCRMCGGRQPPWPQRGS